MEASNREKVEGEDGDVMRAQRKVGDEEEDDEDDDDEDDNESGRMLTREETEQFESDLVKIMEERVSVKVNEGGSEYCVGEGDEVGFIVRFEGGALCSGQFCSFGSL